MAPPCRYATSKVMAIGRTAPTLPMWRMLDPAMMASTGKIPLGKLFVLYVFTPAKFGGWRAWFRCPGCGQRCRVLYGTNSLRCRKCQGLKCRSQYETRTFRLLARARKVRRRLAKSKGESGWPM
jgi:hypothetical protein